MNGSSSSSSSGDDGNRVTAPNNLDHAFPSLITSPIKKTTITATNTATAKKRQTSWSAVVVSTPIKTTSTSTASPATKRTTPQEDSSSIIVGGNDEDFMVIPPLPLSENDDKDAAAAKITTTATITTTTAAATSSSKVTSLFYTKPLPTETQSSSIFKTSSTASSIIRPIPSSSVAASVSNVLSKPTPWAAAANNHHHQKHHQQHPPSNSSNHNQRSLSFSKPSSSTASASIASSTSHHYSKFTTNSISALQNDIGTLLARSNRVTEAMERYSLAIASAEGVLKRGVTLSAAIGGGDDDDDDDDDDIVDSCCSAGEITTKTTTITIKTPKTTTPMKKCPKVTEAEGLAWFHQKLLRGDIVEEIQIPPLSPPPSPPNSTPDFMDEKKENNDGNYYNDNDGDDNDAPTSPTTPHDNKCSHSTLDNAPSLPLPPPPPFQPAGFGGCALPSPRRIRSASFCAVDLNPRYHHSRRDLCHRQQKQQHHYQQQQQHPQQIMKHPMTPSSSAGPTLSSSSSSLSNPPPPPIGLAQSSFDSEDKKILQSSPKRTSFSKATLLKCPQTAPYPAKPALIPRSNSMSRAYQRSRTMSFSSVQFPSFQGTTASGSSSHHYHQHTPLLTPKKTPIAPLDDIVHDIHQHQKLDCSDDVYSCNGRTPLGLEYICDPLPVLGGMLRKLVAMDGIGRSRRSGGARSRNSCGGDTNNENNDDDDDDDESKTGNEMEKEKTTKMIHTATMEYAALIAARLNLASLEYRKAGGGVSDNLQNVLETLRSALNDCHSIERLIDKIEGGYCKSKIFRLFGLLEVVAHANMATVLYRLNKVRDALASLESAKGVLEKKRGSEIDGNFDENDDLDFDKDGSRSSGHDQSHPHDDNRFPPREMLVLIVRLNLSRVLLRVNKPDEAEELCALISKDASSSMQRRKSSRALPPRSFGFHRSNSFSVTTSALDAASAAYQHDLDRRSKWLASVAEHYLTALVHEARGETSDYKSAVNHYNKLLSLARVKLDHRHPYICALLERRGAVLFEQRKLQCSMLSYLACLKILEHQQATGNNVFNIADLARVLYGVARVLHDKEDYLDALHMYQRALECQRALTSDSSRPSLDVITTLCNISRVHHLMGEIDAALTANQEALQLATLLVGGKMDHPFLIHRLKIEGNILVEAGRMEDAMRTFVEAARRCSEDGRDRMMAALVGGRSAGNSNGSQEDADAGDSSVLSIRSAASLAHITFLHPAAAAA